MWGLGPCVHYLLFLKVCDNQHRWWQHVTLGFGFAPSHNICDHLHEDTAEDTLSCFFSLPDNWCVVVTSIGSHHYFTVNHVLYHQFHWDFLFPFHLQISAPDCRPCSGLILFWHRIILHVLEDADCSWYGWNYYRWRLAGAVPGLAFVVILEGIWLYFFILFHIGLKVEWTIRLHEIMPLPLPPLNPTRQRLRAHRHTTIRNIANLVPVNHNSSLAALRQAPNFLKTRLRRIVYGSKNIENFCSCGVVVEAGRGFGNWLF